MTKQPKSYKRQSDVKLTSDWNFMIVFELRGPKLVPITNFSSISLQMADFSLFCGAKSCEVPSVIMLPWQHLKT